jgi:hypothetical protein
MKANSTLRRYHRLIAVMMCIPLALTIITGMVYPVFSEWVPVNSVSGLLLKIHSGRIFGLQAIYPVLNGLGLAGLLVTGLSMTRLFRQKRLTGAEVVNQSAAKEDLVKR